MLETQVDVKENESTNIKLEHETDTKENDGDAFIKMLEPEVNLDDSIIDRKDTQIDHEYRIETSNG